MKRIQLCILIFVLFIVSAKSQNNKQLSLQLSYNQFNLAYQNYVTNKLWVEITVGLSNQDIDRSFNDFITNLNVGYTLIASEKYAFNAMAGIGLYVPNNDYYKAETLCLNLGIGGTRYFGDHKKHSVFINAGYQYGKKKYKQIAMNEIIYVSTLDEFEVTPVYFSLGYGIRF